MTEQNVTRMSKNTNESTQSSSKIIFKLEGKSRFLEFPPEKVLWHWAQHPSCKRSAQLESFNTSQLIWVFHFKLTKCCHSKLTTQLTSDGRFTDSKRICAIGKSCSLDDRGFHWWNCNLTRQILWSAFWLFWLFHKINSVFS